MQKNSFLTFVFSFMPGCGHMYLGAMKKGTFLLAAFWVVIFLSSWLNLGLLMALLPVLWFYSFFDAMNLRLCHYEYIHQVDNQFAAQLHKAAIGECKPKFRRRPLVVGIVCILLGLYLIINNVILRGIYELPLPGWVYDCLHTIPTALVAIAIIILGIILIRKKDNKAEDTAEYTEYKGDIHE